MAQTIQAAAVYNHVPGGQSQAGQTKAPAQNGKPQAGKNASHCHTSRIFFIVREIVPIVPKRFARAKRRLAAKRKTAAGYTAFAPDKALSGDKSAKAVAVDIPYSVYHTIRRKTKNLYAQKTGTIARSRYTFAGRR